MEGGGEGLDRLAAKELLAPSRGYARSAVEGTRELAADRCGRVSIVAKVGGAEDGLAVVARGREGPDGGLESLDDVARTDDLVLGLAAPASLDDPGDGGGERLLARARSAPCASRDRLPPASAVA